MIDDIYLLAYWESTILKRIKWIDCIEKKFTFNGDDYNLLILSWQAL